MSLLCVCRVALRAAYLRNLFVFVACRIGAVRLEVALLCCTYFSYVCVCVTYSGSSGAPCIKLSRNFVRLVFRLYVTYQVPLYERLHLVRCDVIFGEPLCKAVF